MAASYETVKEVASVLVKVPTLGTYMNYLDAFQLPDDGGLIPERYQNGMVLKKGHILNRNFYGLKENDLGRNVVATVVVKKKTMEDGRWSGIHHDRCDQKYRPNRPDDGT